jgi:predicted O-methyltransferase YrrM
VNQELQRMLETGKITQPDGIVRTIHSHISMEEGLLLQGIIHEIGAKSALEVGLAFGVSAHFICDALSKHDNTRHTIIEPDIWANGFAIKSLENAGYGSMFEVINEPSHIALLQLIKENRKYDFVFIDGRHRFDYVLLDFFMADKLLKIGGILAFDDADHAGVLKTCRYIVTNRSYTVYRTLPSRVTRKRRIFDTASKFIINLLDLMHISERVQRSILSPEFFQSSNQLGLSSSLVVLKKIADDSLDTQNDKDIPF